MKGTARVSSAVAMLCALPLGLRAQAAAPSGEYIGVVECVEKLPIFHIRMKPGDGANYTGEFWFPSVLSHRDPGMPNNPLVLKGSIDMTTLTVSLRTERRFGLSGTRTSERFTLKAAPHPDNYLLGSVDFPGCSRVVAVSAAFRNAQYAALNVLGRIRGENARVAAELEYRRSRESRKQGGWVPVELTASGGPSERRPENPGVYTFEYFDATMDSGYVDDGTIRPLDEVFNAFRARDERCLRTDEVSWQGTTGTAKSQLFDRKSYVVECNGDCTGLLYTMVVDRWDSLRGHPWHAGKGGMYPTLTLQVPFLVESDVSWTFTMPEDRTAPPPGIRIHTWAASRTNYGSGCRFDWT